MGRRTFGPFPTAIPTGYTEKVVYNAAATGAISLYISSANVFDLTLTGAITLTVVGVPALQCWSGILKLRNTAGRVVTYPASFKWPAGAAPATSAGAAAVDVISFFTTDGGTTYQAAPIGFNFS